MRRDLTLGEVCELALNELLADSSDLIDEEYPLDMVVLMLDDTCRKARISLPMRLEVRIQIFDGDGRGTCDPLIDPGDA